MPIIRNHYAVTAIGNPFTGSTMTGSAVTSSARAVEAPGGSPFYPSTR